MKDPTLPHPFSALPHLVTEDAGHVRKVFAKPFSLLFKRPEDQTAIWIKVETLDGLRNVCQRIAEGGLVPVDAFSTLDRQLWGHLAEHVGFLRYAGPADDFSAGLQPAGAGFGELAGDLGDLFGEDALGALSEMRKSLEKNNAESLANLNKNLEPVQHRYVKHDGVNLTPEGEQVLSSLVGDPITPLKAESDNAIALMGESEPGLTTEEMDAAVKPEADNQAPESDAQKGDGSLK